MYDGVYRDSDQSDDIILSILNKNFFQHSFSIPTKRRKNANKISFFPCGKKIEQNKIT